MNVLTAEGQIEKSGQHWLPAHFALLLGQLTTSPTLQVAGVGGDGVGAGGDGVGAGDGGDGDGGGAGPGGDGDGGTPEAHAWQAAM